MKTGTQTNSQFVIDDKGLYRVDRTITAVAIDMNQTVLQALATMVVRQAKNVIPCSVIKGLEPSGPMGINLSIGQTGDLCWSIPLVELTIECGYATSADGKWIYPHFRDKNLPKFKLKWIVPGNMRLVLAHHTDHAHNALATYLVAFDTGNRAYRLPLSNLYKEAKLCTGAYTTAGRGSIGAIQGAVTQFIASNWQGDLYEDADVSKTQSLFGFRNDGDVFTQNWDTAANNDWTKFCDKIAVEFITNRIVL